SGTLLRARAQDTAPESAYPARALEVMDHMEANFRIEGTDLYMKSLTEPAAEDMWGCGVMFSALVAAARYQPAKYEPIMRGFFKAMDAYWDSKVAIPGYEPLRTGGNGNDKYYDDNAWMVITFLEAYELTKDAQFLKRADEALIFVLSGWDEVGGGGIWWHEGRKEGTKNTCANAPSAVGCLRLAQYVDKERAAQLVKKAEDIVKWTVATFQDEDALFWDSKNMTTGHINRGKLSYNTGLMLRAILQLHRHTGKPEYLDEAKRIGKAGDRLLGRRWNVYRSHVKWGHLMVEADLELYRKTKEAYLLERAKGNADSYYDRWKDRPMAELIGTASIARQLWLMADAETELGRKFWEGLDRVQS
ncbi:MAG: glycoside hydrolase family 76 protein, partial [Chthoniobacteraceae bacterium]